MLSNIFCVKYLSFIQSDIQLVFAKIDTDKNQSPKKYISYLEPQQVLTHYKCWQPLQKLRSNTVANRFINVNK